ncbi:hypothetical protein [Parasitella parasitica]|uniref:Uncharacterized protein n=1 Tax=Parasitella parasitica TaxID=35722 RepID=A0A0B7N4V7_9FUNG|nr:hypothetical protein [Parasitella parasitica]
MDPIHDTVTIMPFGFLLQGPNNTVICKYPLMPAQSGSLCLNDVCLKTPGGNFYLAKIQPKIQIPKNNIHFVMPLDIYQKSRGYNLLNISKMGVFWFALTHLPQ